MAAARSRCATRTSAVALRDDRRRRRRRSSRAQVAAAEPGWPAATVTGLVDQLVEARPGPRARADPDAARRPPRGPARRRSAGPSPGSAWRSTSTTSASCVLDLSGRRAGRARRVRRPARLRPGGRARPRLAQLADDAVATPRRRRAWRAPCSRCPGSSTASPDRCGSPRDLGWRDVDVVGRCSARAAAAAALGQRGQPRGPGRGARAGAAARSCTSPARSASVARSCSTASCSAAGAGWSGEIGHIRVRRRRRSRSWPARTRCCATPGSTRPPGSTCSLAALDAGDARAPAVGRAGGPRARRRARGGGQRRRRRRGGARRHVRRGCSTTSATPVQDAARRVGHLRAVGPADRLAGPRRRLPRDDGCGARGAARPCWPTPRSGSRELAARRLVPREQPLDRYLSRRRRRHPGRAGGGDLAGRPGRRRRAGRAQVVADAVAVLPRAAPERHRPLRRERAGGRHDQRVRRRRRRARAPRRRSPAAAPTRATCSSTRTAARCWSPTTAAARSRSCRSTRRAGSPASVHVLGHVGAGPHPQRQEGPHAHFVAHAPGGWVLVVDLGTDEIRRYRREAGRPARRRHRGRRSSRAPVRGTWRSPRTAGSPTSSASST